MCPYRPFRVCLKMNSMPTHQYNMMHYNNSGNNHPVAANPTNQSQKMGPGPMNPGMNSMKMPSHPQGEGGSSFGRNRSSPYSYPNPSNSHINQKRGHMNQSMGPNPNFAAPPGVVPQVSCLISTSVAKFEHQDVKLMRH